MDSFKALLIAKPMSEKQKRSKVTEFIAHQKDHPECISLVDKLIDKAHLKPLHLKNNAWVFSKVLFKEAVAKSNT